MGRFFTKGTVATAILCAAGATAGWAQTPTGQTIQQRKLNQQDRIAQGVKSGQLTAGETGRLERREASISHQEDAMRRADNGHLTQADRAALTKRQNRVSQSIYRDKHNPATQ
jgi:hypothetical protein